MSFMTDTVTEVLCKSIKETLSNPQGFGTKLLKDPITNDTYLDMNFAQCPIPAPLLIRNHKDFSPMLDDLKLMRRLRTLFTDKVNQTQKELLTKQIILVERAPTDLTEEELQDLTTEMTGDDQKTNMLRVMMAHLKQNKDNDNVW